MSFSRSLALGAFSLLCVGCLNIQPHDGAYLCATDSDCPSNYACEPSSHSCWQRGHKPALVNGDMSGVVGVSSDGGGEACQHDNECTTTHCNTKTHSCVGTSCEDG